MNRLRQVAPSSSLTVSLRRVFVAVLLALVLTSAAGRAAEPEPVFEKDVLPLFQARCLKCHGADKQKAGLDLRTKAGLLKGGETGPALKPGSARDSLLWEKLATNKMPPGKEKLTEAEKALVRTWIDKGARASGAAVVTQETADRQVSDADRQFWS